MTPSPAALDGTDAGRKRTNSLRSNKVRRILGASDPGAEQQASLVAEERDGNAQSVCNRFSNVGAQLGIAGARAVLLAQTGSHGETNLTTTYFPPILMPLLAYVISFAESKKKRNSKLIERLINEWMRRAELDDSNLSSEAF